MHKHTWSLLFFLAVIGANIVAYTAMHHVAVEDPIHE